ncbi:MAG: MBOAT family protein, partial [Bacteroidota bacterium]|nr:MBOAT family protein [Bacteroidota bacterium]
LTMLLGGLWHGANIRFVIWGTLHGLGLVVNRLWDDINPLRNKSNRFYRLISIVLTFHFVAFAWMFFRAEDINSVLSMMAQILHHFDFVQIPQIITGYKTVFLIIGFAYLIHWLPASFRETYRGWFIQTPVVAKVAVAVLTVFILYQSKSSALQPFIYFQF